MATSTLTLLANLPDGVLFENVESIEVKITTKGVELSGQHRLADCDHESIREAKTICVELSKHEICYVLYCYSYVASSSSGVRGPKKSAR